MSESKRGQSEYISILQKEGVSLQIEGVDDVALAPAVARRAISALRCSQMGITGGEVWKKMGDRFVPTYDIWDVEETDYPSHDAYVLASLEIAERQVQKYADSKDDVFVTLGI